MVFRGLGKSKKGFTLIELVVVVAITAMLILGLLAANFRSTAAWVSESKRAELEQNLRYAADVITTDVRQAEAFGTAANPMVANAMINQLTIEYEDPQRSYDLMVARYLRTEDSTQGTAKLVRIRRDLATGEDLPPEDITESITSLSSLHFIVRGPRVTIIMIADYPVGTTTKSVTYVAQASARNLGPAQH